jgi:ribonuclease PH
MSQAIGKLVRSQTLVVNPIRCAVAAVSVGIVGGIPMLDLNYPEDSTADVDFNLVMTDRDEFIEIQGTAERLPFRQNALEQLLELGRAGIRQLIHVQQTVLRK